MPSRMRNYYSAGDLERVMQEDPFDPEMLQDFLKTQVCAVHFCSIATCNGYILPLPSDENTFEVYIDNCWHNHTLDEEGITLVHEILHGFYHATGKKDLEDCIERTAQRFYKENKEFVNDLVEQLERGENLKTILL